MSPRKMTTIRVDEDLLRKAHDLGLNVSKIAENALKEMIRRVESPSNPKVVKIAQSTPNKHCTDNGGAGRIWTPVTSARGS